MKKISIITINKNNRDGLRKTIESVILQTFTDFEYIVIDGASTDESVEVIKEYADKITYWVSEPDKGIYNAMNKGILQANGEYCLFLNSGDWLLDEIVLQNVFGNIKLNASVNLIVGKLHHRHDRNLGIIKKKQNEIIRFSDFYTASLPHPSTFIKRDLLIHLGLYNDNNKIVSDWEFFMLAVIKYSATYIFIDVEISDKQPNGIASNMMSLHLKERQGILMIHFSNFVNDYNEYFFYKRSRTISKISKLITWFTKKQSENQIR